MKPRILVVYAVGAAALIGMIIIALMRRKKEEKKVETTLTEEVNYLIYHPPQQTGPLRSSSEIKLALRDEDGKLLVGKVLVACRVDTGLGDVSWTLRMGGEDREDILWEGKAFVLWS